MAKNTELEPTPPDQKTLDAQYAHNLENNPLLDRCFQEIQEQYTDMWLKSKAGNVEDREHAYRMLKTLELFRQHVKTYINTGNLDQKNVRAGAPSKQNS